MKVSIIIPISKREQLFELTLVMLAKQKLSSLTWNDLEIIIVAKNKNLVNMEILKRIPTQCQIEIYSAKSAGEYRNKGASVARGELLLFLDGDCIPTVNWVEIYFNRIFSSDINLICGNTKGVLYHNKNASFFIRNILIQPLKDYSYKNHASFFTFDSSNFAIRKKIFSKNLFSISIRFEDQIFYHNLMENNKLHVIISNSNNVQKVINESLGQMIFNILSHNYCSTLYFTKEKNSFIKQYLTFIKSTTNTIFKELECSSLNRFHISLYYLFNYAVQLIFYIYFRIKKILLMMLFVIMSSIFLILYLPETSFKHSAANFFPSLPMLHVSFWAMYSENGLYFSKIYFRCKKDQTWVEIKPHDNGFIEYKKQIVRNIYPYFLVLKRADLESKITNFEQRRCIMKEDKIEIKVEFRKHLEAGDLIVFDTKIFTL